MGSQNSNSVKYYLESKKQEVLSHIMTMDNITQNLQIDNVFRQVGIEELKIALNDYGWEKERVK